MAEWARLVMAAQAGDREAFGVLVDGQAHAAYRVAQVIVGNSAAAQDVVQEACIRAWRDLPRLRDAERWPHWFRRVAVRAAIDVSRSEARQRHSELSLPTPAHADQTDHTERAALRDEVAAALRHLAPNERALLALRFAADLEVPDVAAALGLPLGTAKSRLHRALEKLRRRMEQDR